VTTESANQQVTVFGDLVELAAAVGAELGPTDWLAVDQARVDQFAQATDDHQWIHVDPQRAADGAPRRHHRARLAHAVAAAALHARPASRRQRRDGDQLRFQQGPIHHAGPGRVATASRVEGHRHHRGHGGVQATLMTTIEVEGADKPAAVVESIIRYMA
jgi:acyl dehydratase